MSTKRKTAIVIGATGLIGSEVVKQLVKADKFDSIVTLTRRPDIGQGSKVRNMVVDFDRLEDFADAFQGDVFFSCLGTTRQQAGSLDAQRTVDLDYQLRAAKIALRQGVTHYLLVSSSGANASSLSTYLKMKGELENAIKKMAFQNISVFQPSLLLGEREDFRAGELLAAKVMPLLCKLPGLQRYRPIRGSDVAKKMVLDSLTPISGLRIFKLDQVFPD